jgi:GNAT superfamily N-acetyltransferase
MGQGIGTKLMHSIEDEFKDVRRFELFTGQQTAGALHIYYKMGYREFKQKEMDTHTLVFLEKNL